jgi:GntR family transcriptional regulator, transcriptional repressor for pyruvate dehydrogenase complex
VYDARKVIEPAAVRMLAARRDPEDVAELRTSTGALAVLVNNGADNADLNEWSTAAFRFHDIIMERSGNTTMTLIGAVLREVVTRHMSRVVATSTDRNEVESQFKKTIRAFSRLTALVESGEAVAAEEFWRDHMEWAGRGMLWGDLATETVVDLFV